MSTIERTQPQDPFTELAKISLADDSLDRVMGRVAALAKSTLNLNGEVSVTVINGRKPSTIASTGSLATALDERQYDRGHGPCLDCIAGGKPLMVKDMDTEQRWPDWARSASRAGAGSILSIPLALTFSEASAALNIYSTDRDAFDETLMELASTFATCAVVALTNMHLYAAQRQAAEHLQIAMRSRAVIEQAKGILVWQRQCTPQEAFDILVTRSQNTNRKLRDVAEELVNHGMSSDR
jgi:transcriptional regulator with GAF, ATPase, and Fis domain